MTENLPVQQIDYGSAEVVKTLVSTVAHGLNQPEFRLFVEHCKATGLNPFKKEVWAIKAGGRLQIMTGNQGFHTIANRNEQYDGMETGFVGPEGEYLPMTYPRNDFIGAWARVHRKDRKVPMEAVAMLNEYDKGQGNWKVMRRIMIVKCAESLALRKAFPQELNGVYSAEEMPVEYAAPRQSEHHESPVVEVAVIDEPAPRPQPVKAPATKPAAKAKAAAGPKYGPQAVEGVSDFESYKYRYHLPYQKEGVDMNQLRKDLKYKHGFKFNPEDKFWYSNEIVDSVKQYLKDSPVDLNQPKRAPGEPIGVPEFDNDPMPEWDTNDIPF